MIIYSRNYVISIFIIIFLKSILISQNLQSLGFENNDKLIRLPESFVVEADVNPDTYILGPEDKIGLSIITSSNMAYILTITPMGELWIPDIGAVHISGMNIKDAKNHVTRFIQENRFKSVSVSMVLLNIRRFKIQVVGAVYAPGFVDVYANARMAYAIKKSGGLHKMSDENRVSISRADGKKIVCSLKTYQTNGDLINNPILKEGDRIYVPYIAGHTKLFDESITHKKTLIYVTGSVLKPSGYDFIPGYSANDYIAMSGGITIFGNLKKRSIYRHGKLLSEKEFIILQPGDQIDIPVNLKYRILGNMSILQTMTAVLTLYLTYQAAIN